jgi:hypothetical protein
MKYLNLWLLTISFMAAPLLMHAQTADEIISKYVEAIGGKNNLSKINSMYMENSLEVMGNASPSQTVILNGKGSKTVSEIMGQKMVQCYTEKGGWMINPMAGSNEPVDMPADQYNAGKSQMYITDILFDYATKGYKVEYLGTENVGSINTYKLKVLSPDNITLHYFIDPATNYVIKMNMTTNMMGQEMTISNTLSDYRKTADGMVLPFKNEVDYGGQFSMVLNVKKVEFNKPVDPVIFEKGNMSL